MSMLRLSISTSPVPMNKQSMYVASIDQMSASCLRPIHIVIYWTYRRKHEQHPAEKYFKNIIISPNLLFFIMMALYVLLLSVLLRYVLVIDGKGIIKSTYGYLCLKENHCFVFKEKRDIAELNVIQISQWLVTKFYNRYSQINNRFFFT